MVRRQTVVRRRESVEDVRSGPLNPTTDHSWGHSSAGRAPALQAGGHRFESGCLHYLPVRRRRTRPRSGREANNPPEGRRRVRDADWRMLVRNRCCWSPLSNSNCIAWKGHEIVARVVLQGERFRRVNRRRMSTILFFVRVNQVLVRLWTRVMEAALCVLCSSRCSG